MSECITAFSGITWPQAFVIVGIITAVCGLAAYFMKLYYSLIKGDDNE